MLSGFVDVISFIWLRFLFFHVFSFLPLVPLHLFDFIFRPSFSSINLLLFYIPTIKYIWLRAASTHKSTPMTCRHIKWKMENVIWIICCHIHNTHAHFSCHFQFFFHSFALNISYYYFLISCYVNCT